jgi:ammonia channel protein AmtB
MVYDPTSLVMAEYAALVAGLISVTLTPGITAPVESVTIPVIAATFCARKSGTNVKAINKEPVTAISLRIFKSSSGEK